MSKKSLGGKSPEHTDIRHSIFFIRGASIQNKIKTESSITKNMSQVECIDEADSVKKDQRLPCGYVPSLLMLVMIIPAIEGSCIQGGTNHRPTQHHNQKLGKLCVKRIKGQF